MKKDLHLKTPTSPQSVIKRPFIKHSMNLRVPLMSLFPRNSSKHVTWQMLTWLCSIICYRELSSERIPGGVTRTSETTDSFLNGISPSFSGLEWLVWKLSHFFNLCMKSLCQLNTNFNYELLWPVYIQIKANLRSAVALVRPIAHYVGKGWNAQRLECLLEGYGNHRGITAACRGRSVPTRSN